MAIPAITAPQKIYYDTVTSSLVSDIGEAVGNEQFIPDSFLTQKEWFNLKLFASEEDNPTADYTGTTAGTTFEILADNDYNNPAPILPTAADFWASDAGHVYKYTGTATYEITEEPLAVYETGSYTALTKGTYATLVEGEWAWDSDTLYVWLTGDVDPTGEADAYVSFKYTKSYTASFFVVDPDTVNAPNSWAETDSSGATTYRNPVLADGEISFYVNTNTLQAYARMIVDSSVLSAGYTTNVRLMLKHYSSGDAILYKTISFPFILRYVYEADTITLELNPVNFYTKAEQDARFLNKVFSSLDTKATIVAADTLAGNNSEDSSNPVVLTFTKMATFFQSTLTFLSKTFSDYTEKTTPADADTLAINDSAASFAPKWLSWSNVKATLKTYFDSLYSTLVTSPTNNHVLITDAAGQPQDSGVTLSSIVGGMIYQGAWNADTNTPTIVSSTGTQGHYYVVSVAGTTAIDGISDWEIGDWIVFNGTTWEKIDNTETNPIDAANIADGSVSNTEFQYINSLSSNAQDQLDAKEEGGAVATHAALLTGVHGLAITAGKTLTVQDDVTITGALGSAAYTATGDYEPAITNNVEADGSVAGQLKIWDETAGLWDNATLTEGANITITEGDGTITIASTATGGIDWDNVITSATNAVAGNGYIMNVNASAFALTLSATPSVGDVVGFKSINSSTYAATLGLNGLKFEGATGDITLSNNEGGTLVYASTAYGWTLVSELADSSGDGAGTTDLATVQAMVLIY